ncbi:MAG: hypothetical protein JXB50_08255 [Spirochaetes bacterium]|nr:hypothetical protein [Spirochaetota bacterium]
MNQIAEKNNNKTNLLKIIIFLSVFGISFGFIEGSIVYYLRLIYYPEGFDFNLIEIDKSTIIVEMIREFCTLAVIFAISYLAVNKNILRFSFFVYSFAVWDIFYYVTLHFIEGWPKTLLDWDVLFLIPVPWFAPVISPIIISLSGILIVLIIIYFFQKNSKVNINVIFIIMILVSLMFWLNSFINYSSFDKFPEKYNWVSFFAGVSSFLSGAVYFILINSRKKL